MGSTRVYGSRDLDLRFRAYVKEQRDLEASVTVRVTQSPFRADMRVPLVV